jgi:hypothetical protein
MNGTTTTTRTQTVDGVTKNVTSINYPTNTLTISNNSNKIIFSCNNSLGQLTYYNATNYVYNYVVLMYQNKSLTTKKKAASVGAKNATKDFTSYVFKKKSIENKTTYLDFWECYDLLILNSTDVAKKVASISPTITISHILLTVIVLMLAYMANTCLSMTRHKILHNKIAELPRIKQGFNFVPSIIKKNSTFLKVINEATRPKILGHQLVQQMSDKFAHLGCGFQTAQTYRSMVEYSFYEVEDTIAAVTHPNNIISANRSYRVARDSNDSQNTRESQSTRKNQSGRDYRSSLESRKSHNSQGSGGPLLRQNGQSVREFLLVVVPRELNLSHAPHYKARVENYLKLYERARYYNCPFSASDLVSVLDEVHFMKGVFGKLKNQKPEEEVRMRRAAENVSEPASMSNLFPGEDQSFVSDGQSSSVDRLRNRNRAR